MVPKIPRALLPVLVSFAVFALSLDAAAASRRIDERSGVVVPGAASTFSVGARGGGVLVTKIVTRGGLVPIVQVFAGGQELPRGAVEYTREGHVLKFSVRGPAAGERVVFRVTGRSGSAGAYAA